MPPAGQPFAEKYRNADTWGRLCAVSAVELSLSTRNGFHEAQDGGSLSVTCHRGRAVRAGARRVTSGTVASIYESQAEMLR